MSYRDRNALERALKSETYAALMLVEVQTLHEANVERVALFLERFAKERDYLLYRLSPRCFALHDHAPFPIHPRYEEDIEILFSTFASSGEAKECALVVGLSMEKRDAYTKAEIALDYAKEHQRRVIAYSRPIDPAFRGAPVP